MINLEELLRQASVYRASDIHIAVGVEPKMRINGRLVSSNFPKMTASDTLEVLLGIVSPEQRETFESEGVLDVSVSVRNVGRFRVNAYKQRGSIALAIRLVDMEIPDVAMLRIPEDVMGLCDRNRGLVLITGPAGSGKSTMLAAMIDSINQNREVHIITLEDPIEYLHQHKKSIVDQREIGMDAKSYLDAMRASMREDPDVIQINELPDSDTINSALIAAQTGRLVFSEMNTLGAVETIEWMIDMFPVHQQKMARNRLADVLLAVISRQLAPTMDGAGSVAAYEILYVNNQVKDYLMEENYSAIREVMLTNRDKGMILMDESLTELFAEGKIDKDTAIQFAKNQELMTNRLASETLD